MKSRFIDKSILFQKLVPTLLVVCSITLILLIPLAIWVAYGPMSNQTDTVTIGNSNNILLPILSAGLMIVFAIFVLNRYISSNKIHFFFWGTGLLMFSVVSLSEIYLSMQWNRWAFFFWYFFGAVLNAAWIGQGTICLLLSSKWLRPTITLLLFASSTALIVMLQTMSLLDVSKFDNTIIINAQYRNIIPAPLEGSIIRLMTPFFNVYGATSLIGGAVWSAYLFWRKSILPNRVIGNILIAIGAIIISTTSILTRIGVSKWWHLGELLAAILLFVGFIFASRQTYAKVSKNTTMFTRQSAVDYTNE